MNEAPPPPPAPAPEPKKDRKARRREKFGPSLDEQIQAEEAQKEFEGGRPASADDLADSETVAQRVFSGREVSEESAEAAAPAEPSEAPEPDAEIPHEELRKSFEEALAAAIPGEDDRPSPARAAAEPEPVRRAASRAARPTRPRRDVPKPRDDAARDLEVTGISAPTDELAAAGVTQEELAANHRERIAEMQRMNPGWESSTGLSPNAAPEKSGAREPKVATKKPEAAKSPKAARRGLDDISPAEMALLDRALEAPTTEEFFDRYHDALKASGAKNRGQMMRAIREKHAGASIDEIKQTVRSEIEAFSGGSSATDAPTEQAAAEPRADVASAAEAAEPARKKKVAQKKASTVWPPADDSAARLAGYRLEKRGLRGAEFDAALPAEARRRGEAMRKVAGGGATAERPQAPRAKRQPILGNVPDVPAPAPAPEPVAPEVLARDEASIRKQRDVAAAEISAAREEWKAEAAGEARVDALAALDKKIEEKRRRAPKKGDGENVRAAVASVAAPRGTGPSAATEAGLAKPVSFDDFYAVLRARTPAVVGSAQEYSADDIIEIVEGVRRGDLAPEHLTRTFGIRETAVALIEAERLEKARAALGLSGAPASPAAATAGAPGSVERFTEDDYRAALETVFAENKASTSLLQRRLGLGYEKSRALLDELARRGVISDPGGALPRAILMNRVEAEATVAKPQTPAASPSAAANPWVSASRMGAPGTATPSVAGNPWVTAAGMGAPRAVARPRLVAAGGGAGGAGTPPPPAGGPANVPPAPGGRRRGPAVAPAPALPPRVAAAPAMGIFARASQSVKQLGVGAVGVFKKFVEEPSTWLWKKAERPGSYNTKEAPFKNQTSIFYPITGSIGALWKIIGGWFGAKFETPKEEKKK